VLISCDIIFQELEKGMPGGPPRGISDLIADIFNQQTQSNDSQPPSNLLSSPKTNRIFDLVPVVCDDDEAGLVSSESATDSVFVPEQIADVFVPEQLADPVHIPEQVADSVHVPEQVADPVFVPEPVAEPVFVPEPVAEPVFVPEPVAEPIVRPILQPGVRPRRAGLPDQDLIIPVPRIRTPVVRWIEESTTPPYAGLAAVGAIEPTTLEEALASPQADQWKLAMEDEMRSLEQNETWTLTKLPAGRQPIQNRWVFKLKLDGDGAVRRYKARLVAKGFTQRPGIDFEETFSPVVKHDSLRAVLAVAAERDLNMLQLDVKTAFLNGDLNEELYMTQPTGFVASGREGEVCKLNRSIYGLKQASRAWNIKIHGFLIKFGFIRSSADPCVYIKKEEDCLTIIAIWVDDGLICGSDIKRLDSVVEYLSQNFEMTCEPVDCFVGIQIVRDRGRRTIHLSQENYIARLLEKFNLSDCHARIVPADPFTRLSKNNGQDTSSEEEDLARLYREAVGALIYAVTCTRLDISWAVSQVAQFSSRPTRAHWEAVKRILAYLKGTQTHGVTYGDTSAGEGVLQAYSDADFAANVDDRRSTTGVVLMLNGGPVSWKSKRQSCVSLSTTESEYVAAAAAAKEIVWMRRLLQDLGCNQLKPTYLFCDNQSAIKLVRNPQFHQRTKHIDVKFHFIRDLQEDKVIDVVYVNSEGQLADLLTKGLDGPRFRKLREEIGISV
jgi:hypothetical protein